MIVNESKIYLKGLLKNICFASAIKLNINNNTGWIIPSQIMIK